MCPVIVRLTCDCPLRGCGRQQWVVVRQAVGVEDVEARDERGRRAVHPLLLRRLHAVCRVQRGHGDVSAEVTEVMKAAESPAAFTTHHSAETRSYFSSARALRAGLTERTP